jgi:hypothetical protein
MFNTIVGAVGAGAASRYGSGSDQMMQLRLRNTDIFPHCHCTPGKQFMKYVLSLLCNVECSKITTVKRFTGIRETDLVFSHQVS